MHRDCSFRQRVNLNMELQGTEFLRGIPAWPCSVRVQLSPQPLSPLRAETVCPKENLLIFKLGPNNSILWLYCDRRKSIVKKWKFPWPWLCLPLARQVRFNCMAVSISINFNGTAYCLYKHREKNEAADFMMGAILGNLSLVLGLDLFSTRGLFVCFLLYRG